MVKVNIFREGISMPRGGLTEGYIKKTVAKTAKLLGLEDVSVSLILTDNEFIKKINTRFRKKKSATDVISFPNRENRFPAEKSRMEDLGDIFISLEMAMSRSDGLRDEMKRLIVHGLLHLLGYDHEKSKKVMEIMRKKENEILQLIP